MFSRRGRIKHLSGILENASDVVDKMEKMVKIKDDELIEYLEQCELQYGMDYNSWPPSCISHLNSLEAIRSLASRDYTSAIRFEHTIIKELREL